MSPKPAKLISSRQPTRLMVGLIYLKHSYNLSDEQVLFGGSAPYSRGQGWNSIDRGVSAEPYIRSGIT